MIEVVSTDRCIGCDVCLRVCPTNVFDRGADRIPVIARQADCQTCFMCEAWCPTDALFVAPPTEPLPADSALLDESYLAEVGLLGSYRRELGWGDGRTSTTPLDESHRVFAALAGPPPKPAAPR